MPKRCTRPIYLETSRPILARCAGLGRNAVIPPGRHPVEPMDNPTVRDGRRWLVVAGTTVGAAEPYLRGLARVVDAHGREVPR